MCLIFLFLSIKYIQVSTTRQHSSYKVKDIILLTTTGGIPALANVMVLMEVTIIQQDCITD